MRINIVSTPEDWSQALSNFSEHCPSTCYSFHNLYRTPQNAEKVVALFLKTEQSAFFYPFLQQRIPHIPEEYYTASSVYGFTGPLFYGLEKELEEIFFAIRKILTELKIVAEFIRLSPLSTAINISKLGSLGYKVSYNRELAFSDIAESNLVTSCNMSRRALKAGCCFQRLSSKFENDFINLYNDTMKLNEASPFFYYSPSYFDNLFNNTPDLELEYFGILHEENLIAATLFLCNKTHALYHLGCNNRLVPGASDLALRKSVEYLHSSQINVINLTGGRTSNTLDPLLSFKKRFSNTTKPFHIATYCLDVQTFNYARSTFYSNNPNFSKQKKFIPWS